MSELACPVATEDPSAVVAMFARIARRYDLANRLLSFGRDHAWRRAAAGLATLRAPRLLVDVAAGTGDFAAAFARRYPDLPTLLADPCRPMLERARAKGTPGFPLLADAGALPLATGAADLVACAFGIRNFRDPDAFLRECGRVLRPGGELVLLEFGLPPAGLRRRLLERLLPLFVPVAGRLAARDGAAYRYLAASIGRFASVDLSAAARRAGLKPAARRRLFFGLVTALLARRV